MAAEIPILPETVVNQIHLWAGERQRVEFAPAMLYEQFNSEDEFVAAEKYARDLGALLWSRAAPEAWKCVLAVMASAHPRIKSFLKERRPAPQQAAGGSGAAPPAAPTAAPPASSLASSLASSSGSVRPLGVGLGAGMAHAADPFHATAAAEEGVSALAVVLDCSGVWAGRSVGELAIFEQLLIFLNAYQVSK